MTTISICLDPKLKQKKSHDINYLLFLSSHRTLPFSFSYATVSISLNILINILALSSLRAEIRLDLSYDLNFNIRKEIIFFLSLLAE